MTTINESNKPDDGGPAFPRAGYDSESSYSNPENGMSLRAYAAINLRVSNSGIDWLDDMIRASKRDEIAAKAPAVPDDFGWRESEADLIQRMSRWAYAYADAMLHARDA